MMFLPDPHAFALAAAALVSAIVVPLAWRHRAELGGRPLLLTVAACFLWELCAALEAAAADPGVALVFAKAGYVGSAPLGPLFLTFSLRITRQDRLLTPPVIAALFLVPLASVLLSSTNEWHHLFWASTPRFSSGIRVMEYAAGPWWWVLLAFDAAASLASAAVIAAEAAGSSGRRRTVMLIILIGMFIPWAGLLLPVLVFDPFPGLNYPPLFFAMTGVLIFVGISRLRLFDLVPVARNVLLEVMGDGVVVMDGQGTVLDTNPAARKILCVGAGSGRSAIAQAIEPWQGLFSGAKDGEESFEAAMPSDPQRTVEIRAFALAGHGDTARMLIIRDVTRRRSAEAEREKLITELRNALGDVKTLSGLLPICARCKKIRDDSGYWREVEHYIMSRSTAHFSHGLCPDCIHTMYPELDK